MESSNTWLVPCVVVAFFGILAVFAGVRVALARKDKATTKRAAALSIVPDARADPRSAYRIEPFQSYESPDLLHSYAAFQDILTRYSCSSDNGTGYWASADGVWIEKSSGRRIRMEPDEIRRGRKPEAFFTHIIYLPK